MDSGGCLITGRPSRSLRRSRGKRRKVRDARAAMVEAARLHDEGYSTGAIASKVRLPARLVEDVIEAYTPAKDEGTAA